MYGDEFMTALTAWRENRSGGRVGMQSVMNVIVNSARRNKSSLYKECIKSGRYSSVTEKGPEAILFGAEDDASWFLAQQLAREAVLGNLPDITDNSIMYYAASLKEEPYWVPFYTKTAVIAGQIFFKAKT